MTRQRSPRAGQPAGERRGRLLVVATPIGNLDDLSPRARAALAESTLILAEDTRRVRKLLTYCGLRTPATPFHEHNEQRVQARVVALLEGGAQVALVSDAGTPLLADPGFRLVRRCRELAIPVYAVPGPSAVVAALSVAGLPPLPFTFLGYLPPTPAARRRFLSQVTSLPHTLVMFLSPHRLAAELRDCAAMLGESRPAALLAELTKLHERCLLAPLADLSTAAEVSSPRGEYTLVVAPPIPEVTAEVTPELARQVLEQGLAKGLSLTEARREASRLLRITRKELYRLLLVEP